MKTLSALDDSQAKMFLASTSAAPLSGLGHIAIFCKFVSTWKRRNLQPARVIHRASKNRKV
jgi:hypothetical protein